MSKYKVGDKVVVKPWAMMEAQYGPCRDEWIKTKYKNGQSCSFTLGMEAFVGGHSGRALTIAQIRGDMYKLDGDPFDFCDDMFLGLHFELGEKIEVSDDLDDWFENEFWGYRYCPNIKYGINGKVGVFTHARKLQPKLTIRVEMNGKELDPKQLSDESWMALKRQQLTPPNRVALVWATVAGSFDSIYNLLTS